MTRQLPPDHPQREQLYSELHARPSASIELPALVVLIAVLNEGVALDTELAHLQRLPGQSQLASADLEANFLRLQFDSFTLKWERHSEFTRYSLVLPLPAGTQLGQDPDQLRSALALDADWIRTIPGQTLAAVDLWMLSAPWDNKASLLSAAQQWMQTGTAVLPANLSAHGHAAQATAPPAAPQTVSITALNATTAPLLASLVGRDSHSMTLCDFQLRANGWERMLVLAPTGSSPARAGRVAQRLLEIETYRLMALRGLSTAKQLGPQLSQWEAQLARLTANLVDQSLPEEPLLGDLVALAAAVEKAITTHAYRFSATQAYYEIVRQRLAEIREHSVESTQTLGAFLHRRLDPAMATVNATQRRLTELSQRIARASALLRTRVDIATEKQNQQLLEKLTRGQQMQLRLQTTVEGLSIAAVSYYAVSLLLYAGKALKAAGAPVNPELFAGASIPLVIAAVWAITRKIHRRLFLT